MWLYGINKATTTTTKIKIIVGHGDRRKDQVSGMEVLTECNSKQKPNEVNEGLGMTEWITTRLLWTQGGWFYPQTGITSPSL